MYGSVEPEPAFIALEQTMLALYEFDFFRADSLSDQMLKNYPDHYLSHFTRAQYLWWLIITQNSNSKLQVEFSSSLENSLRAIEAYMQAGQQHIYNFFFINIYAMLARLNLKNREYLRTILSLKNCINQVGISLGNEILFPPYNLTSGMYNYLSEYSAIRYPFLGLYTLLYPKGNMELGLKQLKIAAANENLIWKTEASYLLLKIFLELEKEPARALIYGRYLVEKFPNNLIFQWHNLQISETIESGISSQKLKTKLLENTRMAKGISQSQKTYLLSIFEK